MIVKLLRHRNKMMAESMHKSSSFLEPSGFQLRKRKRKNGEDHGNCSILDLTVDSELNQSGINAGESKRKKTLSKVTSMASILSTPMAKAFKKSVSSVRLSGSPAPKLTKANTEISGPLNLTPGKFFTRSSSVVKVLQQHNSNTPEGSPLLKRGGIGRNSSTNLTPYK